MRKTVIATAFVLATGLLTGCGGGAEDSAKNPAGQPSQSSAQPQSPSGSGRPGGGSTDKGTPREVTIEVQGKGRAVVMWTLDESKSETVTLPWKRTATITPEGAEKKVGRLIIVTPGTIEGGNGMLTAAACTITVDGKQVSDNGGGKIAKPCSYKLTG
ncbi:hypothetical protein ACLGI4_11405 [Streptomyces sp. HMX112]|uniref:hypothetical protein n=1 Tax=Streptomyces sp. HMX112 TaxID=3390850 RepID=UPI003A7FA074